VVAGVVVVGAFADDRVVEGEDAADGGVGRREAAGGASEVKRAGEVKLVLGGEGHAGSG